MLLRMIREIKCLATDLDTSFLFYVAKVFSESVRLVVFLFHLCKTFFYKCKVYVK